MFVLTTLDNQYAAGITFGPLDESTTKYATIGEAAVAASKLDTYAYPVRFTKSMLPAKPKPEPFAALKARARAIMSDDDIRKHGKLNCRATFERALDAYVVPPTREERRASTTYKAMCVTMPDYRALAKRAAEIRGLEYAAPC